MIFYSNFGLYRILKGLDARTAALQAHRSSGSAVAETMSNAAFREITLFDYDSSSAVIKLLEKYGVLESTLRDYLIEYYEVYAPKFIFVARRKDKEAKKEHHLRMYMLWEKYELSRKMIANEAVYLSVAKP